MSLAVEFELRRVRLLVGQALFYRYAAALGNAATLASARWREPLNKRFPRHKDVPLHFSNMVVFEK